jgi:photosystem II stability/assembly factor-like uncharacterized protein
MKNSALTGMLSTLMMIGPAVAGQAEGKSDKGPGSFRETPDVNARQQSYERRAAAAPSAAKWETAGPYGMGRVNDVEVDPGNDQIVYVGAASGGVWKSTNGGSSYAMVFNDAKSQSIGDMHVAPSNPAIVWVGTGEATGGGGSLTYPGAGVYKSVNGGATFQHMGLDSSFYISKISIHPTNPDIVLAAVMGSIWQKSVHRGVYRTADGGATWTKVLGSGAGGIAAGDDSTGATDVRFHPTNPSRVFANFWVAHRQPYNRNWAGPSCRMHRSDDGGVTWRMLGTAEGLPTTDLGRNTMDICLSNPNVMYVVYLSSANTLKAIYRSANGGDSWAATSALPPGQNLYSNYAQAFCKIFVNPHDANDVVVSGISSYRTTSGGAAWSRCFLNTHADANAFAWSRQNPNLVYEGDDGGFATSPGGPNGVFTYRGTQATGGLQMAQIYNFDMAPDNASYRYLGLQDNGVLMSNNSGSSWQEIVGGDGMCVKVDYGSTANVLACWQNGNYQRSSSRGTGMVATSGFTGRGPWDAPIDIDPSNGMVYVGSEFIHRAARGTGSFTRISPDLSNGNHSISSYSFGTTQSIRAFNGVVYAGTDDGNVWVSRDSRAASPTWTRIRNGKGTGPDLGERSFDGWIKEITIDESVADGSSAYVAISYYRWGEKHWKPCAYHLTNFGLGGPGSADWKDISGDLPPHLNVNKVIKDNAPGRAGWLYAATEFGMYYSSNGGMNWSWLGDKGLPLITVNDINLHAATSYLYAGTYGRGLLRINLAEVPVHAEPVAFQGSQILRSFPNPVITTAKIRFQVRSAQRLQIAVYDFTGRLVRTLLDKQVAAEKLHTVAWDRTDNHGAKVGGGSYVLRAIGEKTTLATKLDVR